MNAHLVRAVQFIFLTSSALLPAENVLLVLRQTAYAYTNADVYDCYGMGDKPQYTNQVMWHEKIKTLFRICPPLTTEEFTNNSLVARIWAN